MTSFKMAAKETVGKSELCIVLPILDRVSQSFFYFIAYILDVIDSEYAKKITKDSVNLSKNHNIYFFIAFLMH